MIYRVPSPRDHESLMHSEKTAMFFDFEQKRTREPGRERGSWDIDTMVYICE